MKEQTSKKGPVFRSYGEFREYYFPESDTPEIDPEDPESSAKRLVDWAFRKAGLKPQEKQ